MGLSFGNLNIRKLGKDFANALYGRAGIIDHYGHPARGFRLGSTFLKPRILAAVFATAVMTGTLDEEPIMTKINFAALGSTLLIGEAGIALARRRRHTAQDYNVITNIELVQPQDRDAETFKFTGIPDDIKQEIKDKAKMAQNRMTYGAITFGSFCGVHVLSGEPLHSALVGIGAYWLAGAAEPAITSERIENGEWTVVPPDYDVHYVNDGPAAG